jgi:NAD(P)-dependent dehydrogenase (short-subunit alcohol dehydrogenase family)
MLTASADSRTEVCSTHCASPYFTTAAFLPLLAAAKDHDFPEPGNVIQIASLSGITRTSQRGQMAYNTSKAGTIHLALMQSTEFARRGLGIRVVRPLSQSQAD